MMSSASTFGPLRLGPCRSIRAETRSGGPPPSAPTLYAAHTAREPWRSGDLLLAGNLRCAHGREAYIGLARARGRDDRCAAAGSARESDHAVTVVQAAGQAEVARNQFFELSVAVISAARVQPAWHVRVRELTDLQSDERMVAA